MEASGLISRRREAANRRIQVVDLTEAGEKMFGQLASVAQSFDKRLRRGVSAADVAVLEDLLDRLGANAGATEGALRPWSGLADGGAGSS
jgi:MarR family transcriptional regulator for hemolysin